MIIKIIAVVFTAILFSACNSSDSKELIESELNTTGSSLTRLTPVVDQSSTDELVQGINTFAFDMYGELKKEYEDENLFFSPLSISTALAMIYPGANGDTKSEMKSTLHFTMDDTDTLNTFNLLDSYLNQKNDTYIFKELNALWPDSTFEFKSAYLDSIMQNFGAKLYPLDFINNTEQSRVTINEWVEEQTNDKIVDLLEEGDVTNATRLVLTNAVYFNAKWVKKFSESATQDELFYLLDNTSVNIPMMNQTSYFKYFESNDSKVIQLPYEHSSSSMVIVLPDEGSWDSFISGFDLNKYNLLLEQVNYQYVQLKLPKLKYATPQYSLRKHLKTLGMVSAFDNPDFSNITDAAIGISGVLHKAYISVDENGTEAAAATAVTTETTSMPPEEYKTFYINRPFILFIRDNLNGQILFMGEILDPRG